MPFSASTVEGAEAWPQYRGTSKRLVRSWQYVWDVHLSGIVLLPSQPVQQESTCGHFLLISRTRLKCSAYMPSHRLPWTMRLCRKKRKFGAVWDRDTPGTNRMTSICWTKFQTGLLSYELIGDVFPFMTLCSNSFEH